MKRFVFGLEYDALGKPYDVNRVLAVLISQNFFSFGKYDDDFSDRIVCSH